MTDSMDLTQIIELFESKHTCDLSDRHTASIIQLCKEMNNEDTKQGFYFRDLDNVAHVLNLVYKGIENKKVRWFYIFLLFMKHHISVELLPWIVPNQSLNKSVLI